MEQWVDYVVQLSAESPTWLVYGIILSIAYVENIIPPIPGDVIVVFGGYLAATGILSPIVLLVGATITSTLGFMTLFEIGRYWGGFLLDEEKHRHFAKWLGRKYLHRARSWMKKYGLWVVFANRFLAGTRSVISLTAGISHTHQIKTIIASTLSSLFWNVVLIGAGWVLQKNWRVFGEYLANYGKVMLILILLLVGGRIVYKKWIKSSESD